MNTSWTIALTAAIATPIQRTAVHWAQTPKAVTSWPTLMTIRTQPPVVRSARTKLAAPTKKVEFDTASLGAVALAALLSPSPTRGLPARSLAEDGVAAAGAGVRRAVTT